MTGVVDKTKKVSTKMRSKSFKDNELHSVGAAFASFPDGSDTLKLPIPATAGLVARRLSKESRHKHSRSHDHSSGAGKGMELLVEKDKKAEARKSNPVEGAEPKKHLAKGHSASGSLSSVTRADFNSTDYIDTRNHALVLYKGSVSPHTNSDIGHKQSLSAHSGGSLKLSGSKRNFSDGKQYNSPFRKTKKHAAPTKSIERDISVLEILNIWNHRQRLEFYAYLRREFIEENYLALDAIGDIFQQHRLGVLTVECVRCKVYQLYFGPDATWTVEVPLELALELDEMLGFDADVSGVNGFGEVKHQVKLDDVMGLMHRVYQTLELSVTKSFISFTGVANLITYYNELMSEHAGVNPRTPHIKHAHEARSPFGQRRSKYADKSPLS